MPSILSPVYLQACSVFKTEFISKNEWLKHLVEDGHQNLARKECLDEWDRDIRQSCLLVFAKVPLSKYTASKIVNYFSSKISSSSSGVIVTDFIWWEDRLHVGILQFESREKVNSVLASLTSPPSKTIKIEDSQTVMIKAGFKLKALEWHAILPPTIHKTCLKAGSTTKKKSPKRNASEECLELHPPKRPKLDNILLGTFSPQQSQLINFSSIMHSGRPPPSDLMTPKTHPLQFEFWAIRKAMIIRDAQYECVKTAANSIKLILSKLDPNLEVSLFRNWFLKLKYPVARNDVLLYVHSDKVNNNKDSDSLCKYIRNHNRKPKEFKVLKSRKKGQIGVMYLKHVSSEVKIFLMTSQTKGCLMEVQICRLMEYMCQFDPRCYPLMTLACYWVTSNNANIGGKTNHENLSELHPQYTIQWLVLFFMCRQNYIPTPKQIIEKHGFSCDPKFVQEWKSLQEERSAGRQEFDVSVDESSEKFILDVLKLFSRFLQFCRTPLATSNDIILNLFSGILIDKYSFIHKPDQYSHWKDAMTAEEIDILQRAIVEDTTRTIQKLGLYMTNPVCLNHKISMSENIKYVFKLFGDSNNKLRSFISHFERLGVETALEKVGSLKMVLKEKD